ERTFEALEQAVERAREIAELIALILHGKALVQIPGAYKSRFFAHGHNGSESFAREKIPADAGNYQRNRDHTQQRRAHVFEELAFTFERLQRHDADLRATYFSLQDARTKMLAAQR